MTSTSRAQSASVLKIGTRPSIKIYFIRVNGSLLHLTFTLVSPVTYGQEAIA